MESFFLVHPDAVIHCAAYTKVDQAEQEAELCYKINVEGTKNIVQVCKIFFVLYIAESFPIFYLFRKE